MVCIQDARETYVGLAELQRRVLGSPTDQWAADPASDDVRSNASGWHGHVWAGLSLGMYASTVEIDVGAAAETPCARSRQWTSVAGAASDMCTLSVLALPR